MIPQQFVQKRESITVQASENKINPKVKVANKKVESKVKQVSKTLTAQVKSPRKENAPLRTKVKVENVGALGRLAVCKTVLSPPPDLILQPQMILVELRGRAQVPAASAVWNAPFTAKV